MQICQPVPAEFAAACRQFVQAFDGVFATLNFRQMTNLKCRGDCFYFKLEAMSWLSVTHMIDAKLKLMAG